MDREAFFTDERWLFKKCQSGKKDLRYFLSYVLILKSCY